jgi:hypothetical protein
MSEPNAANGVQADGTPANAASEPTGDAPTPAEPAGASHGDLPAGAETPAFARGARDRAPRPLLGPWLWVSGVLLWAYVVMGIFTTSRFGPNRLPLGEGAAVFWTLAAYATASIFASQRSLSVTPGRSRPRAALIAVGGVVCWFFVVVAATVVAQFGIPDFVLTPVLVIASGVLVWMGRRATSGSRRLPDDNRMVTVGLWIGATVLTLTALVVG